MSDLFWIVISVLIGIPLVLSTCMLVVTICVLTCKEAKKHDA